MTNEKPNRMLPGFLGKFVLLYTATYIVTAVMFLGAQSLLPADAREALDFFVPYSVSLTAILSQLIISAVLALVLYPFYNLIVKGRQGWLILFAALWGIALLGSLEPKPGTIEGMLYTVTTTLEHIMVIGFGAIQFLAFSRLFLYWERKSINLSIKDLEPGELFLTDNKYSLKKYATRFTILHLIIYILVGIIFYQVSGYEEALATMEEFALWRDLENIVMPLVIFLGQILRGAFIALMLAPFYATYMNRKFGWLQLFGLLFGLKVLATVITVPESAAHFAQMLEDSKSGLPEIIAQTIVFSLLFFAWEKRRVKKELS